MQNSVFGGITAKSLKEVLTSNIVQYGLIVYCEAHENLRQFRELESSVIKQGIIERVEETIRNQVVKKKIYHLLYRAIYKQDNFTTKTRIVIEAHSDERGQ
ncbi:hypothetical protein NPIL_258301 [Nephila pilipes]|uniref:Uncharacterized protein n=1 Tax=Nephila pilipes TaxID=299642 RepID=A0A8X6TX17_NEPPI|nr:hypothetical protein NPIL_258301 [Nephila pilipes]